MNVRHAMGCLTFISIKNIYDKMDFRFFILM